MGLVFANEFRNFQSGGDVNLNSDAGYVERGWAMGVGLGLIFVACTQMGCSGGAGGGGIGRPPASTPPIEQPSCGAATARLRWVVPTTRIDGSAFDNLYGYIIYWGLSPRAAAQTYTDSLVVLNNRINEFTIENLEHERTYFFAMKSMDTNNLESEYSEEVSGTMPAVCPPGFVPPPSKDDDKKYENPSWCENRVELRYFWKEVPDVTHYEVEISYRRGVPSEQMTLHKSSTGFTKSVRRGQLIYVRIEAKKRDRLLRSTPDTMYHVLTCQQLEEQLSKNPSFDERLELELRWQ